MTSKTLKISEALLLQRYHDGDASREEIEAAEALLSRTAAARIFVEVLPEVGEGVRIAHGEALKRATFLPAEAVVDQALAWAGFAEASLDELAPLLERFHDGEVDGAEAVVVQTLLESREDVAEYLMELSSLATGIQSLVGEPSEVDFGGLWAGIEAAISEEDDGAVALDPYRAEEHGLLLQRFHDQEVDEGEARRVQNWLRGGDEAVDGMLGAMAELHIAVNAGLEAAQEDVDFGQIWAGIEDDLDRIDAEKEAPNVVSLQSRRDEAPAARKSRPNYLAIAAMGLLVVLGGFIATQVMPTEKVVETRTVVIFDSVEYAPGSSVMIHSPELASHGGEEGEEELPILWVIEDEEEYLDEEDVEENEAPQEEEDPRFQGPF